MRSGESAGPEGDGFRFRGLVDAAPDAVLVIDAAGRIAFANARAAEMFGLPVEALVGSDVDRFIPDRAGGDPRGNARGDGHVPARRADGSEFPADIGLSPFTPGRDDELICIVRDAGDRIAAERALLRSEARLHDEQRRVAVARARERIGMDLHDGVIQSLYSVGMQLAAAERQTSDPAQRAEFAKAIDAIDVVIGEIRDYIHGLRPELSDYHDLTPALFALAAEFEAGAGVEILLDVEEEAVARVAPWGEDCLQVVRELLSNVARHADATRARVALVGDRDGGVVLQVSDDGSGYDPDDPHPGMGAGNIRRRVEPVGGVVEVRSTPGDGTTVRITFAVPPHTSDGVPDGPAN